MNGHPHRAIFRAHDGGWQPWEIAETFNKTVDQVKAILAGNCGCEADSFAAWLAARVDDKDVIGAAACWARDQGIFDKFADLDADGLLDQALSANVPDDVSEGCFAAKAAFDPRYVWDDDRGDYVLPEEESDQDPEAPESLADVLISQLLSADDLINRPPPNWLISDTIPASATVVLFGKPGSGKSFVALDWSVCVSLGAPWQGREVTKGTVLYIAAEGVAGLGLRVAAWKTAFGFAELPDISFYPGAINLLDPERRNALVEMVERLKPSLIVVDTMARSMPGGDENSARDVGLVVAALDACRAVHPELTALIVHHTTKDGGTYRGWSGLEGAAEAMVECSDDDGVVTLECDKQKDAEEFADIRVKRTVVKLEGGHTSCVLRAAAPLREELPGKRRELLEEFCSHFSATGASRTSLKAVTKLPDTTFYAALNDLVKAGALVNAGTAKVPFYKLSESADG